MGRPGGRRDLGVALLGAGKYAETHALLDDGPDLPAVRRQLDALEATARDPARIIDGWRQLYRHDLILSDPRAKPRDVGQAHLDRGEYPACRRVLEAELQHRKLGLTELLVLVTAQVRDRGVMHAIEVWKQHAPPEDSPEFVKHQEYLSQLEEMWGEYRSLMEQIGEQIPK